MAFTHKASPALSVSLTGQIPTPPPKIPDDIVKRFPAWSDYQRQFEDWWGHFSDMLQRDRSQVQGQFQADEATAATNLASIQSSLASITSQLNALSPGPDLSAQVAAITAQLAAAVATLTGHVAATRAHGTTSAIVGESDSQDLDNKTTGLFHPGYGRFIAGALGFNQIDLGVTIPVTVNDFLVVAGPLDVSGSLVVDGTLVAM